MKKAFYILLRIIPAFILLQTLPFKLSGAEETVQLFTDLGAEPFGRYLSSLLELAAGIMLLIPKTAIKGAYLTIVLMAGALVSHITILGFEGQRGALAVMAVIAIITSIGVIKTHQK